MNIKNIIFDFGGVLMDWNPRYLYQDLFENEVEMEFFLQNVCHDEWNLQQDAGRLLAEGTEEKIMEFPEFETLIKKFYDDWEIMLKSDIFPNTFLVKLLKNKGYRIFGLTNWSAETFPFAFKRYTVFREFEDIVVSGEVKMIKPNPEIYSLALQRFGIQAEETLFIDDNIKNIQTAKNMGLQVIHLKNALDLESELKILNLI